MTKFSLIISLSFSLISLQCFANESNLDNFNYPSHSCGEKIKNPKKPARLASFEDVDEYNNAIIEYNIKVATYNKTIKSY